VTSWLEDHRLGGAKRITLFTPAKAIAEDAGETIVTKFLEIAGGLHRQIRRGPAGNPPLDVGATNAGKPA